MKIRKARIRDIDDLIVLNNEVQDLHLKTFPEIYKQVPENEARKFFENFLKTRGNSIIIGESKKGVVGYIALRIDRQGETPFTTKRKVVYIDQIVVKEEFRNQGFGQRLMKEADKLAKKTGASWLQLDVWDFNKSAQYFFSANGFDTYVRRMAKKL
jgi:ribosomal protein S18 acetylase RimI-like enzyme